MLPSPASPADSSSISQVRYGQRPLREDGNTGAIREAPEQLTDGGADVVARRQVRGAHEVIGETAMEQDVGTALDQGRDLRGPLVRPAEAGSLPSIDPLPDHPRPPGRRRDAATGPLGGTDGPN